MLASQASSTSSVASRSCPCQPPQAIQSTCKPYRCRRTRSRWWTALDSHSQLWEFLAPLQAVMGTHQLAQTRDPESGIRMMAERLPIERIYHLKKEFDDEDPNSWSAYELCEAYAVKRGYRLKNGKGKVGRPPRRYSVAEGSVRGASCLVLCSTKAERSASWRNEHPSVLPNCARLPSTGCSGRLGTTDCAGRRRRRRRSFGKSR